ncbi:MAG: OmpA family protein [Bacteroidales bacterium]|nr:OmpA family protein [Bacteroidales bacterium]
MRKIIVISILAVSFLSVYAQETVSSERSFVVGARAGIGIFDMRYSSDDVSIYHHHYGVREQIGLFAEYDYLWKGLSVGLDFLYSPRGVNLTWQDIDYRLRSYYLDLRIPISYTFLLDKKIQPYVVVAPSVNFVAGGHVNYSSLYTNASVDFSKANFRPVDFSMFFGAGVKAPIAVGNQTLYVGGEFGYNLGFCNTFSNMELDNSANAINLPMYEVNGTRKNGGFEIAATVSWIIPHKKQTKKVVEKPVPVSESAPVETAKEEPKEDKLIEYKSKECYSIEEMKAFITLNMPIDDKRICMFDLKFEFASAVLKKESESQLDKFVELYQSFPNMQLQITGHTDNVGSEEYNQKLSEERAQSVYDYFLKKGIPSSKMTVKGFGLKYPIATNETEEGRAKNRRVEVDIQMVGDR